MIMMMNDKQAVQRILGDISESIYITYKILFRRDRSVNVVYVEK
jgi:hypothetical protein